jgi:FtsP/CotA-like multicopper oxidase with cupredoxin domain
MYLIGTDGSLIDKVYQKSELLLSPGEKVVVLVKGTQSSGNYLLRSLPYKCMNSLKIKLGSVTLTTLVFISLASAHDGWI